MKVNQPSFTAGELAPSLHGRVDLAKYRVGLAKCFNYIVRTHGGVENRPGFEFVCEVKDSSKATRLMPFEFNTEQTYILEFDDQAMRVIKDGGQVLETGKTITAATQANPVVITIAGHGYANGDEVYISGVTGMTELNGKNYLVANQTTNTVELTTKAGANVNGTGYGAFSAGGTAARVYTLTTPYVEADLFELKAAQSADTMTICHEDYAVRDLTRTGHTSWTLSTVSFAPVQAAPTSPSVTPNTTGTENYSYKITAYNEETAEESLPTAEATISNGATTADNTISWTGASGADTYNVYKEKNGIWGYIGSTEDTTFLDDNIAADLDDTPPKARNPFNAAGDYPSCVNYHDQRKVYGGSTNKPQTMWLSQSANYKNFTFSSPFKDDDAITRTIASRQVHKVRHLVSMGDLIVLTSGGEWKVSGIDGLITPSTINARPQSYYGASNVEPIVSGQTVLFVQARGARVRDLSYKLEADGYSGNDLSVLASHLFEGYTIVQWAYQKEPWSVVWAVRSDGILIAMTYLREHEVWAWHTHEDGGGGVYESVAAVAEGDEDALYVVVKRTINGRVVRYIERMHTRQFDDIEDAFFVDSGLTLDSPLTATGFTNADPCVVTAASHGLSNGDIVDLTGFLDASGEPIADINLNGWIVANATTNTFSLQDSNGDDVDSTAWSSYGSGGEVRKAVTTVSGLDHLEGESVVALANGSVVRGLTVSGGAITLTDAASRIHIGYGYNCDIQTLGIDPGGSQTMASRKRKVTQITAKVVDTRGFWAGPDADNLTEYLEALNSLLDEDVVMTITGEWENDGSVYCRQPDPLPSTILSLVPDVAVGG